MTTINKSQFPNLSMNKLRNISRMVQMTGDYSEIAKKYNVPVGVVMDVRKAMGAFAKIAEANTGKRGRPRKYVMINDDRPTTGGVKFNTTSYPIETKLSLEKKPVPVATQPNLPFTPAKDTPMTPLVDRNLVQTVSPSADIVVHREDRERFFTAPVLNPRKDEMRKKIANAPLRNYIKVYAAALLVHDLNEEEIKDTFGICKASVKSIKWQVTTDLRLHNLI